MKKLTLIKTPQKFIFKKDYKAFCRGEVYVFIGVCEEEEDCFNYTSGDYGITFDGWYLAELIKKKIILILA
jgi:hypothetical protein